MNRPAMSPMSIGIRLLHFTAFALVCLFTRWALAPMPRLEVVVPRGADPEAMVREAVLLAEVERLGWLETDRFLRRHLVEMYGQASGQVDLDTTVLFEEAKALGMHVSDRLVRRHLIERARRRLWGKVPIPDDATLAAYLAAKPDRFASPPSYTVSLRRRTRAVHDASWPSVVAATARQPDPDTDPLPSGVRSPITWTEAQFRFRLGREIALTIAQVPPNTWVGPVLDGDSAWFVRVDQVIPPSVPPLEAVRNEVWADWAREQGEHQADRALEQLVAQWRIDVVNP